MRRSTLVVLLGVYMILMGAVGYARTGSPTPVVITGGIGVLTILIGVWMRSRSTAAMRTGLVWALVNSGLYAYMTFGRVAAHDEPNLGSILIFGTMAVFSIVTLIFLWTKRNRQRVKFQAYRD